MLLAVCSALVVYYILTIVFTCDTRIHYVIPKDFKGPFVVVCPSAGNDVLLEYQTPSRVDYWNCFYKYHIPNDGVLIIRSDDLFHRWHSTSATSSDGHTILCTPLTVYQIDRCGDCKVLKSKESFHGEYLNEFWYSYEPLDTEEEGAMVEINLLLTQLRNRIRSQVK